MALVNPNIAMSFRAPEIQQPNMLADYAAIQQIQGGQQAQQLNALKIQEYERARGEEEGARNFLRGRDLASPDTRTGLTQFGKTGLALAKSLSEQDAATLSMQNVKSQISERDFGLQDKKLKFAWGAIGDASTPELAIQKITDAIKDGVFKPQDGAAEIQQLQGMTPELFRQYRVNKVLQLLDAKDKLVTMLPKIARQEAGGQIIPIQDNPALPGYGLPVAGMAAIAKTKTFADTNAAARLAFDQNKFNWEKANPGFEIREADDGSVVGVNKRTLQAFPVTIGGGAAPAAAPAAGGAGMPGARVSAPQAPLAGATPTAGKPLMGKPKEAPVKFNDTDLQLSGLAGSLKDFRKEVSRDVFTGAKFIPTGQDTARMQAKYTALLMGVKDLYTLGALTGPDMGIIESQLTNPASWSGKFTTKEGFEAQIKVIEDMLKRSATNLENTYSRVPKATKKALEGLDSGAGSENDPLGLLKGN
jgi:hypothetical protein